MAPEQFRSEPAKPASDRYALGTIAYELLTGALPFGWHPKEVVENQRQAPLTPCARNALLPPELDAPILALLNPAADKRPATATAAVQAMDRAWLAAEQRQWRKRETPPALAFSSGRHGCSDPPGRRRGRFACRAVHRRAYRGCAIRLRAAASAGPAFTRGGYR